MKRKVLLAKSMLLLFTLLISAQTTEYETIHRELRSDNSADCFEKRAKFIGGISEFRSFFEENFYFPYTRITVRATAKNARRNRRSSNTLNEIQSLSLIITSTTPERRPPSIPHAGVARDITTTLNGNTIVRFVIEADGSVSNITIAQTVSNPLQSVPRLSRHQVIQTVEAGIIRAISLSTRKWIPAEINCKKVRVYVEIPVNWQYVIPIIVA